LAHLPKPAALYAWLKIAVAEDAPERRSGQTRCGYFQRRAVYIGNIVSSRSPRNGLTNDGRRSFPQNRQRRQHIIPQATM
jgi:hypothetical protein